MKKHVYKLLICTMFIVSFNLLTYAQTTIPTGPVSGSWNLAGSPYLITGHIYVPEGSTLTIDPGVKVEFQGHYKLNVFGRILAIGTPADSIFFTATDHSTGWFGIRFDNTLSTQDSSLFELCVLEYGNANGLGDDGSGGAIWLKNYSNLRVSNSRLANNQAAYGGGAIYCDYSSPVIKNNIINYNTAMSYAGGGIFCWGSSNATITGNNISYNIATTNRGGGINVENSATPDIIGNVISYNMANSQGGGISYSTSSGKLSDNKICNNISGYIGGALALDACGGLIISENVICNNTAAQNGGGVECNYTPPSIIYNCTIANNTVTGTDNNYGGGGVYCTSSSPKFQNVIFYGNVTANNQGNTLYLEDNSSDPIFINCNVQGGTTGFWTNGNPYSGDYTNNIDNNPLFVSPSVDAGAGTDGLSVIWELQADSPCINAGSASGIVLPATDIAGNPRVSGPCVDIGAYEFQQPAGVDDESLNGTKIQIYPNPANDYLIIALPTDLSQGKIEIYSIEGIKIFESEPVNRVDVRNLSAGVYFVKYGIHIERFVKI